MNIYFKPIDIQDKDIFDNFFREDPPDISEYTFTNLFMWRHRYRPVWAQWNNMLLVILNPETSSPFGLPPVGKGDRDEAMEVIFSHLEKMNSEVKICRASERLVYSHVDRDKYICIEDRDNSDYVYSTIDLIQLSGRKYHRKKNHLNRFIKNYQFEYHELNLALVECFIDMQEEWCQMKECVETPDLLSEDYAVRVALSHFEELGYRGGAIKIDGRIEAFALGEILNSNTAVIHIEKANPDIQGLYTAINQLFCSNAWAEIEYINREQDLGIEGLRKAKESYYPHHMVNKYTIIRK